MYSRDEGNSPDDHENDMFEKVTRQVVNRIDELEDELKRQVRSSTEAASFTAGRGPGGGGGGGGGSGPPGGGGGGGPGVGSLGPVIQRQSQQIMEMKRDINEIKQLIRNLAKSGGGGGGGGHLPRLEEKQPEPLPPPPASIYPQIPSFPQPDYGFSPATRPPGANGYTTDPEGGPKRRRRRGKKGGGSGYESDGASVYSEAVPMQYMHAPPSPGSVKSAPGGKKRRQRGKQLTGSWEEIRPDMPV